MMIREKIARADTLHLEAAYCYIMNSDRYYRPRGYQLVYHSCKHAYRVSFLEVFGLDIRTHNLSYFNEDYVARYYNRLNPIDIDRWYYGRENTYREDVENDHFLPFRIHLYKLYVTRHA